MDQDSCSICLWHRHHRFRRLIKNCRLRNKFSIALLTWVIQDVFALDNHSGEHQITFSCKMSATLDCWGVASTVIWMDSIMTLGHYQFQKNSIGTKKNWIEASQIISTHSLAWRQARLGTSSNLINLKGIGIMKSDYDRDFITMIHNKHVSTALALIVSKGKSLSRTTACLHRLEICLTNTHTYSGKVHNRI